MLGPKRTVRSAFDDGVSVWRNDAARFRRYEMFGGSMRSRSIPSGSFFSEMNMDERTSFNAPSSRRLLHRQGHGIATAVMTQATEAVMTLANCIVYVRHPRMVRHFQRAVGYWPDVCRPRTKNEKFLWRKIFDRNPMYRLVSDKLAVRAFVKARCPDLAMSDIVWIGTSFDQAPNLRPGVIIKTNNGSSRNIVISDGPINRSEINRQIAAWLNCPYGIPEGEWNYRSIQPYAFVEKSVSSTQNDPSFLEISCHVLMGKCAFVTVEKDVKQESERIAAYDPQGN